MSVLAIDLLREVSGAGGMVRIEGDMLRLSAWGPLPDDLRARLRQHKVEIVVLLSAAEPVNDDAPVSVADERVDPDLPTELADCVRTIRTADGARGVPTRRWPQIQRDSRRLVERRWLHEALGLGWTATDLFGCDRRAPWYRLDRAGLTILIGGHEIVELDPSHAALRTRTGSVVRYRRRPPAKPPVTLLWELLRLAQATGPPIRGPTADPSDERMAATYLAGPRRHPDHEHPSEEEHGCSDSARRVQ